ADELFYRESKGEQGEAPSRSEQPLGGCVYLIVFNQQGLRELLSLWRVFEADPEAPQFQHGRKKWDHLFKQLRTIRRWGPEDRLRETGLLEEWEERVRHGDEEPHIEVELWYRRDRASRQRAQAIVEAAIRISGGEVLGQCCVEEIAYHALVARLPIQGVADL